MELHVDLNKLLGDCDESSEETSSKALSSTISENEDPAKPCLGELTVEDARLLEQLNSKKKYYGIRDEKTADSVKDLLPLMAMMGHMIDVEKSAASSAPEMIRYMLKTEDTNAHRIMRDTFIEPGDER